MNRADLWLQTYDRLDAALVKAGWPATSAWWRAELERFIRSGKRRWVVRVGRRGGKSSTLCRAAICQGITPGWSVPPGDTAVISFTSLDRDEAGSRLRTIDEALTALGVPHERTNEEISIPSKRLVFRVTTCSIRAVGFTSIMLVGDEMSRWESRETASNPASDVMASQRPTMATQPCGIEVDCSSPWGTDDYHHELFEAGDNEHQCVSFAPTWIANPTITEERTHKLEPDEKIWSREYAAIPGATVSQALDREDATHCFVSSIAIPERAGAFCAIDSSKLRNDEFVALFGWAGPSGMAIDCIGAWDPTELRYIKLSDICEQIASRCHERKIHTVFGDDFESMGLTSEFRRQRIQYHPFAWSGPSKDAAMQSLRRLMRDKRLKIVEHAAMRKEMLACKAHLRPNGQTAYPTNGLDYLSALVTAMHAVNDGKIDLAEPIDWRAFHARQREKALQKPPTIGEQLGGQTWRTRYWAQNRVLSALPEQRAAATFPYELPPARRGRTNFGRF